MSGSLPSSWITAQEPRRWEIRQERRSPRYTTRWEADQVFSARRWRKNKAGDPLPQEHPRLFDQLVYRALGEQYISEGKAAELLGIPMMRFHKERLLEWSDAVAHQ